MQLLSEIFNKVVIVNFKNLIVIKTLVNIKNLIDFKMSIIDLNTKN